MDLAAVGPFGDTTSAGSCADVVVGGLGSYNVGVGSAGQGNDDAG